MKSNAESPLGCCTALIAEDEPMLAEELREMLAALWPELTISDVVHDGVSALHSFERTRPSVVFLDIEIPLMNGLDVARQISRRAHVAFITAYNHHALEAFEARAVDYVLKPVQMSRLAETVQRLKERVVTAPIDLDSVLASLKLTPPRQHLRWVNASLGNAVHVVMVDDIAYFKADGGYTRVVTSDTELLIRKPIRDLQAELDPEVFWQIHRSTLINLRAVEKIVREDGTMQVRLRERPEMLNVSEPYFSQFRQM